MDPIQIVERLGGDNPPTDDELSRAQDELKAALNDVTKAERPDVKVAKDIRAALDLVVAEVAKRAEELEAQRAEVRALREGILDDNKTEDAPADDAPADETTEVKEEPVAASAGDILARLRAHATRVAPDVEVKKATPGVDVKAIGPAAGFSLDPDAGFTQVGQMFSTHAKSVAAGGQDARLMRLTRHFDDSRTLGSNLDLNNRRINDILGPDAMSSPLAASGGLCGPGDVDHSHPICADRGRPVRDSLVQFNAARGRVTFAPAAGIGDLAGNVSVWTNETDADPQGATKPCPPVACPEELSCAVDAVVRCITVGNFQAQFSPEFWASRLELLLAEFDRVAEQKSISEIHAASTLLTLVSEGNVLANFLTAVNRVIAADRSIQRATTRRYRVLADAWIRDAIRNQVIMNLGVANNVDAIQVADQQIASWLASVNAEVTWTYDGTINDGTGEHNVLTDPNAFLAQSTVYVYPQDAFLFLDGGTLDLGTSITDSSLNATNDRQAFAESFEKTCFRGCSSYAVPIAVDTLCGCPVGS